MTPTERLTWDEYFMGVALLTALRSPDPSTKMGCVIVDEDNTIVSTGYNAFPRGIRQDDTERFNDKEEKYRMIVHSEANALMNAARQGRSCKGCSIYIPWFPCQECAKLIIQSGINKVCTLGGLGRQDWAASFKVAEQLFIESGVTYYQAGVTQVMSKDFAEDIDKWVGSVFIPTVMKGEVWWRSIGDRLK